MGARARLGFLLVAALLVIGAGVGMQPATQATAAPAFSPPSGLTVSVSGTSATFNWTAGSDNAWYCVDTAFNSTDLVTFSGSWTNWGCGTTVTMLTVVNLQCNALHYARVYAIGASGSGYSNIVNFATAPCPQSPPVAFFPQLLGPTAVIFSWYPGAADASYCVDTASNVNDLVKLTGSWANHGCGTTDTSLMVDGLPCGQPQVYRVYAWTALGSSYSAIQTFTMPACPVQFKPPTDLTALAQRATQTVDFSWTPGVGNDTFCVETATALPDLLNSTGSWQQHGCGRHTTNLTVGGLACNTNYFWRVYAKGAEDDGYSSYKIVKTAAC